MSRFSKLELGQDAPPPPTATGPAVRAPENLRAREDESYDARGWLARGEEHLFQGRAEQALRAFTQSIKQDSTLLAAWVGQVDALVAMNQTREAEVWTTRALDAFPDEPTLLSLRAALLAQQGMLKRALGASDYAISRGHSLRAWIARGDILLSAKNVNAGACLDKALEEIPPGDWMNLTRLALTWLRHKRHAQALEVFQRAAAAQPANAQLWRHIADCQGRLGFNTAAIEAAKRVLELEPEDRATQQQLRRLVKENPISRIWKRLTRR